MPSTDPTTSMIAGLERSGLSRAEIAQRGDPACATKPD